MLRVKETKGINLWGVYVLGMVVVIVIVLAMGNIKGPAIFLLLLLLLLILVSVPDKVQPTDTKDAAVGELTTTIRRSSGAGRGGHGGGSAANGDGAAASGGGSGESSGVIPVAGAGALFPRNAGAAVHHRRHNAAGRSRSLSFFLTVTVNTVSLGVAVLAY